MKNKQKILTETLYMALHRPGAPTYCTSFGDRGQAKEGKQKNKSWTCFSHAYDFHYAYRYGPFFRLDFLIIDLCLQQKEGTKVGGFPFLVAHCPQTFCRVTSLLVTRESSNNRWPVCIAEVAALLCTTCSLSHEGSFYFFSPIIASQQDGT